MASSEVMYTPPDLQRPRIRRRGGLEEQEAQDAPDAKDAPGSPASSGVRRTQPGPLSTPELSSRVLIIERDETVLAALAILLRKRSYRPQVVSTLAEAASAMAQESTPFGGMIAGLPFEDGDFFA
ncbi:MAG: hypothetical protein DRJ42_06525 [Deltaproteobacteria bacterium]|nr:MAG: hypothetical protein DRJ42_06525 [Deltaproteobacteria bacterium]